MKILIISYIFNIYFSILLIKLFHLHLSMYIMMFEYVLLLRKSNKKLIYLYKIKDAVGVFHKSGMMHQLVGEDVGKIFKTDL